MASRTVSKEDNVHVVTRFILLFHDHPITLQFLQLNHNSQFLLSLAKENYCPKSSVFQQLRTITRYANGCCFKKLTRELQSYEELLEIAVHSNPMLHSLLEMMDFVVQGPLL